MPRKNMNSITYEYYLYTRFLLLTIIKILTGLYVYLLGLHIYI